MIYFDHAATSWQKPPQVYRSVLEGMEQCASVGRSGHLPAREAADRVYRCRRAAARLFEALPEQVCFTSNATHGLNIAIHSLIKPGDRVVISGYEHNAVVRPLSYIGADICVAGNHHFDSAELVESFRSLITEETAAVICTHVSNVFGYILPVEEISGLCAENEIPFVLDASQSAGVLPVSLRKIGKGFVAMPGHKGLYGPQGTGILLCGQMPEPLMQGGTGSISSDPQMPAFLPDRIEPGTHNVPGICGLWAGLEFVEQMGLGLILSHEQGLAQFVAAELNAMDRIKVFAPDDQNRSGVLSFAVDGMDCEEIADKLAINGICVRAGLHCAPLAHRTVGTEENGTVRISFSAFNFKEEADRFLDVFLGLLS